MTDPRRLLEGSAGDVASGDPFELGSADAASTEAMRSLLSQGRRFGDPPAGARAQVWGRLESVLGPGIGAMGGASVGGSIGSSAPSIGAGAAPVASTAPAAAVPAAASVPAAAGVPAAGGALVAKTGAGLALGTKLGLLGMLAGSGLFVATVASNPKKSFLDEPRLVEETSSSSVETRSEKAEGEWLDHSALAHARTTQAEAQKPSSESVSTAPVEASNAKTAAPSPSVAVAAGPSPSERNNLLLREAQGVGAARAKLAGGDASGALEELRSLDREVPKGGLGQERRVLAIEALAASGKRDQARELAKAFLDANPSSPYAPRLSPLAR